MQGYTDDDEENIPAHPLLQSELLGIKSSMGLYTGGGTNPPPPSKQNGGKDCGQAAPPNNYQMNVDSRRSASEETSESGMVGFPPVPWASYSYTASARF